LSAYTPAYDDLLCMYVATIPRAHAGQTPFSGTLDKLPSRPRCPTESLAAMAIVVGWVFHDFRPMRASQPAERCRGISPRYRTANTTRLWAKVESNTCSGRGTSAIEVKCMSEHRARNMGFLSCGIKDSSAYSYVRTWPTLGGMRR